MRGRGLQRRRIALLAIIALVVGAVVGVSAQRVADPEPVDLVWSAEHLHRVDAALEVFERPGTEADAMGELLDPDVFSDVEPRLLAEDGSWRMFGARAALVDGEGVCLVVVADGAESTKQTEQPQEPETAVSCAPVDDFVAQNGLGTMVSRELPGQRFEVVFAHWYPTGGVDFTVNLELRDFNSPIDPSDPVAELDRS